MAKEDYTTELDSAFAEAVTEDKEYNNILKALSIAPTFTDKFNAVQKLVLKYPTNLSIVDAATQWLKDNSGDLYDSSTTTYLTDGAYRNALLEVDTKGRPLNKLFTKINQLRTDNVSNALKETAPDLSKTEFDTSVTELTNGSKTTPYDPTKYIEVASKGTPAVAYKKGMTADQLKTNYGSLIDPTTKKPVFTSQQLDDVANGVASASAFNKKVNSLATDAVNKSQDWSLYGGKTGSAYVSAIKNMVSDPSKLATVYKAPAVTDNSVKGGSGIDELITPITTPITTTGTKTGQVPSLKTWKAPQQGVATANSPYSGLLDATIAKVTGAPFGTPTNNAVYKNLTDPLTQGMGLDSLTKPKLIYDTADTAGITGLGDVKGTLQSLNTQVTSTPSYNQNQIANANTALDNAAKITGVDPNKISAEKLAAGKMKWVQDLQNKSSTPVDYYTKLANNTLYADLAETGKAALTSYAEAMKPPITPPVTPPVTNTFVYKDPKEAFLHSIDQQYNKDANGYYTALSTSPYSDLQSIGQSGLNALKASQTTAPSVTAATSTGQPLTLTSPNYPQPITPGPSPYNQSGVGTLPAGQNVVKDVTNTALTNGNLGASLVNQQAQAAAVPVNPSQMTSLQSLQNQPGMTAEKYYAALAADPAYAAAGNSGIAALAAQKNQPAPIIPPATSGATQTFTLT